MNISWIREHRFIHRHPVLEAIKFDFADSGKVLEELESL